MSSVTSSWSTDVLLMLVVLGLIVTHYLDWRLVYGSSITSWPRNSLYFLVTMGIALIALVIGAFVLYP